MLDALVVEKEVMEDGKRVREPRLFLEFISSFLLLSRAEDLLGDAPGACLCGLDARVAPEAGGLRGLWQALR